MSHDEYLICDSCSHAANETIRHSPPVPCNRNVKCNACGNVLWPADFCTNKQCSRHGRKNDDSSREPREGVRPYTREELDELAAEKQGRDTVVLFHDRFPRLLATARQGVEDRERLGNTVTTLISALQNWGRHFEWCVGKSQAHCSCGLAAAIEADQEIGAGMAARSPGSTPGGRAGVQGLTGSQEGGSLPLQHSPVASRRAVPSQPPTEER